MTSALFGKITRRKSKITPSSDGVTDCRKNLLVFVRGSLRRGFFLFSAVRLKIHRFRRFMTKSGDISQHTQCKHKRTNDINSAFGTLHSPFSILIASGAADFFIKNHIEAAVSSLLRTANSREYMFALR